ncbi:MAG: DinB family protein [Candidatus Limnocylindria bacterium]
MKKSPLNDAFGHHVWATLRVIDACLPLTPEQLQTSVPGTYGSILDTIRHLVGADAAYLGLISDGQSSEIQEDAMDLAQLRSTMVALGPVWAAVLAANPDPDRDVIRHREDGSDGHAPLAIRLAQAIHHGTDHRSQVCTALTTLGTEPPAIDVWDYGADDGRVFETEPTS